MRKLLLLFLYMIGAIAGCNNVEQEPTKIAFLADVHLTNIYGELTDSDFKGLEHPENGKYVIARTMAAQLSSTRLFNENYFAFLAALDDIVERDIKIVAFPGDYTDDGQPINIRGLREILEHYDREYGIQFVITTGNHDPVRPYLQDAGKRNFLGEKGKNQPIYSDSILYKINPLTDHKMVVSDDVAEMGYQGIVEELGPFGYLANEQYLYWATPFSKYDPSTYSFDKAITASRLENRVYAVSEGHTIPDASYLVEPVHGIWLLAIDGNVYLPTKNSKGDNTSTDYGSPGSGYNNFSDNKDYFMQWLTRVTEQADQLNKTIIAFSHYPAVDYNDDASPKMKELLGDTKWQLERVPAEQIAEDFAKAGIQVHIAGHMHINDTGVRSYEDGSSIINIQTPSLAAYRPGYKIATVYDNQKIEIETVTIDSVTNFNQLFPLYEIEYDFLENIRVENIWDRKILNVESYHDFTLFHLKELVRLRFIDDWPEPIRTKFLHSNIKEFTQVEIPNDSINISELPAYEMLLDLYKLRNADFLALKDISGSKIEVYNQLIETWRTKEALSETEVQTKLFLEIFEALLNGQPADHFTIDLKLGSITESHR
jgi:hypothetical protein